METEIKFGVEEDSLFQLLNPEVCEYQKAGETFTIEEIDENGKAKIKILPKCPCFVVRCLDDKENIRSLPFFRKDWHSVTRCADHVVFLFDNGEWTLHIFELKYSPESKKRNKWKDILFQLNGAMVRAYSIAGVLRIPEFYRVCLYCAYRNDETILSENKSSPANLKSKQVTQRIQNSTNFLIDRFSLMTYPKRPTKNALIKLDDNGYAEITLDKRGCTVTPHST